MVMDRTYLSPWEEELSQQNYRGLKIAFGSKTLRHLPRVASSTTHPLATSSTLYKARDWCG